MADRQLNIVIRAQDQTQVALRSVTGNLASLGKIAAGTTLGLFGFQGVTAIFKGVANSTLGMNQSMDATKRSAVSMLDSIRNSTGGTETAFAGSARQVSTWGRQLREIREREQQGIATFAARTADLNRELEQLLSGRNIRNRVRDEGQALDDLRQRHEDTMADLQSQLSDAQNEGLLVDGVLYRQANEKRVRQLQERIEQENREYAQAQGQRKREFDEDLADLTETNNRRIAEVRRSLAEEGTDQQRFIRDIKEDYADLDQAKRDALSGGGGGVGMAAGSAAAITYREELQRLGRTSAQIFGEFDRFFREEGVRSPFNIADIQRAGAQLIQFSGGSLKNMQGIVRMAEALASSPAVAGFSGTERMDLAIRALTEAYNGQFTSIQRIFNISASAFDSLQSGTFTTTQFTEGLNNALEQSGINYGLVNQYSQTLEGSWGNLLETGNLLLASISSPVYDFFTQKLIQINSWVTNNQQKVMDLANTLRNQLAGWITGEVSPAIDRLGQRFVAWLGSPNFQRDLVTFGTNLQTTVVAMRDLVVFGAQAFDAISRVANVLVTFRNMVNETGTVGNILGRRAANAPVNALGWLSGALFGDLNRRAAGGPVSAGQPYIVGEREPELFVPRTSGTILNGDQLRQAGAMGATVNIGTVNNYHPQDMDSFARHLGFMITR